MPGMTLPGGKLERSDRGQLRYDDCLGAGSDRFYSFAGWGQCPSLVPPHFVFSEKEAIGFVNFGCPTLSRSIHCIFLRVAA